MTQPLQRDRRTGSGAPPPGAAGGDADIAALTAFLRRHRRIAVLSGAGVSTGSGIPDYRDAAGNWKHPRPVQFADYLKHDAVRRRYWARSFGGWQRIARARPNAAHHAIVRLEQGGRVSGIVTQNVDNLHRRAGNRNVVDLHGTLERVICLQCGLGTPRQAFQRQLSRQNPDWESRVTGFAPDGDSLLEGPEPARFAVPPCAACGGILKPDVVFFGEAVPAARVGRARAILASSDALLVVGSSLMVFSGFRFAREAATAGMPIAILNRGVTRADALATSRFATDCTTLLPACVTALER